jgi:serine/threonine-protein kinase
MNDSHDTRDLAAGRPARGEELSRRLGRLWRAGQRPDVRAFLDGGGELDAAELAAVLRVDQGERWRAGDPVPAESYLRDFPVLGQDGEAALDLVYHEFLLREEGGGAPDLDEYQRRFPQLAEPLRRQVELHRALNLPSRDDSPPTCAVAAPTDPLVGQVLRQYRIVRRLGGGGMGVVYEAEHSLLGRRVALKVMKPELAAEAGARERFLREARAVALLEHDHVVTIHEADEVDGVVYLVMPLLQGQTLEWRLRQREPLSMADVLRIGAEVAEGLAAAHSRGLVHRDVKPGNIWLETKDEGGRMKDESGALLDSSFILPPSSFSGVKLLDFGLVRTVGASDLSASGALLGTPHYMSPEQARGEAVDARSDLFSLGTVLYRMATGALPFAGDSLLATLRAIQEQRPVPAHELRPDLPAGFGRLLDRLLAKAPADRMGSAAEAARELRALAATVAGDTPSITATASPTPVPDETDPGSTATVAAGRPVARSRRGLRYAGAAVGVAALVAAVPLAAYVFFRDRLVDPPPDPEPAPALIVAPKPAPAVPAALHGFIDATVVRQGAGAKRYLSLSHPEALPLRLGSDYVRIEAKLNRPAYLYVVWIDTDGKVDLVYPFDEIHQRRLPDEAPVQELFWPSPTEGGFVNDGPAGTSTLLLLARDEKLPEGTDVTDLFGKLGPQKSFERHEAAWFEDGRLLAQGELVGGERKFAPINFPIDRGVTGQKKLAIDDPVMQVQWLLQSKLRGHFTYSRAVCFSCAAAGS